VPDILICDDDPTARFLLKRVLVRELNANVTEAPDGLQALRLLTTSRFDALILDLRMPVMDGPETLEVVRNTPELRDIPVIVLSGETDADVIKRVVHAGVTDFLLKPLSRTGTQQRLMQIIERLRGRDPAPTSVPTAAKGVNLSQGQTILVADPAEDFRYFCRVTLGRRFTVVEATTGVEAFDAALRLMPAAVLVGRGLTLLGSDALARKLRATAKHPMGVLAVAAKTELPALQASGLYDGCLTRTFVADAFEQQLEGLGFAASPLARLIERVPGLRTTVISATEQVFGMMVKMDVELVGEKMPPFGGTTLIGKIPLSVADEFEIDIDLICTEESANVFAVAMFGVPEPMEVLAELANIVAGRVKHAIVNHNLAATLGLPNVENIDPAKPVRPAELSTRFGVIGTTNQLDVSLRVRERARTAVVTGAAETAPAPAAESAAPAPAPAAAAAPAVAPAATSEGAASPAAAAS